MDDLFDPYRGFFDFSFAAQGGINFKFVIRRPAPDDGKIGFAEALRLHRQTKAPGGSSSGGDQYDTAGFAIKPGDDGHLAAIGDFKSQIFFQPVPQGGGIAGHAGVDQQVRWFVHHHVVIAFPDDIKIRIVQFFFDETGACEWKRAVEM